MDYKEILNNLKERFQALNKTQQIAVLSIPVVLALLTGLIFFLTSRVHYTVLYGDLNNRDMAAIVEQLEKDNVKYKITQDGKTILVPESEARQLRLKLAAMGLPTKGYPGFKL
jgi:Flagellar biosynthesis/type III secretory pathway lipoprotein